MTYVRKVYSRGGEKIGDEELLLLLLRWALSPLFRKWRFDKSFVGFVRACFPSPVFYFLRHTRMNDEWTSGGRGWWRRGNRGRGVTWNRLATGHLQFDRKCYLQRSTQGRKTSLRYTVFRVLFQLIEVWPSQTL